MESKMKRRDLIKLMVGGTAISFVSAAPAVASILKEDKKKKHLAMVIDLSRCNGCKACVVSCGVENGNLPDENRTSVLQASGSVNGKEYVLNLPLLCNQCELPTCTEVCPTGATFKRGEDGIVVVDASLCINCELCVYSCPYEGVRFVNSETKTVDKCNFCIHRTSIGLLPACVETCTGAARVFGDLNDETSEVAQLLKTKNPVVLQSEKNTQPNVFYIGLTEDESNVKRDLNSNVTWQR